ncbi:MAG TPA: tRNA lysidine(34) synthetase TilS [Bacillales bacterium]
MRQDVDRFIKRHHLLKKGAVVVVGISGGPDSMALLDYLESVRHSWGLTLIAASADHSLRGSESAEDLAYVESFCLDKEIIFEGRQLDVKAYRDKHGLSVQAAARDCRYHFFSDIMDKYSADFLALAHHGDDQVETMLMRQVRGSIGSARAGIPLRRPFASGKIIRPLLAVDKAAIETYCREQGINPRRDPSNESDAYTRNRFRHHVLPFLKEENPNTHTRFQLESEMLHDDHLYLEQLAKARLDEVTIAKNAEQVTLSIKVFRDMPMALQRRLIHLVLDYLYRQIPSSLSVKHIEDVIWLLSREHPSGGLDFPLGLKAVRSYDHLIFTYKKEEDEKCAYEHRLTVPGEIRIPGGRIVAEFAGEYHQHPDDNDGFVCDADLVRLPLRVRTRRPGDRLSPKGMKGSKKVKAIFINGKIPRDSRKSWPLVVDAEDTVLWVPGLKHSRVAHPSAETRQLIVLRFRQSGNVLGGR